MFYIILPTHKNIPTTKLFLRSIREYLLVDYTVILIDDDIDHASSDAFESYENVIIVKGNGNLWWGGAINAGIAYLFNRFNPKPDDICVFANNDVQITPTTFPVIAAALKKNKNALYHPCVFNQKGEEVSAGSRVITWFPYISRHPKNFASDKVRIDLATARFLCFTIQSLNKIGRISENLPHYGGDNDFSLRAKKMGIPTFLLRSAVCILDDKETGLSSSNIMSVSALWSSLISTRSSNNLKYRFRFVYNYFHCHFFSIMVVFSMTITIFIKYIRNRLFNR
jgi:N-acetylglucosaminyl-diphospho-decaprenol L-rhamnosyltransferase